MSFLRVFRYIDSFFLATVITWWLPEKCDHYRPSYVSRLFLEVNCTWKMNPLLYILSYRATAWNYILAFEKSQQIDEFPTKILKYHITHYFSIFPDCKGILLLLLLPHTPKRWKIIIYFSLGELFMVKMMG